MIVLSFGCQSSRQIATVHTRPSVMSISGCGSAMVYDIAARSQVLSLSAAPQPTFALLEMRPGASTYFMNRGTEEEVLATHPDLAITTWGPALKMSVFEGSGIDVINILPNRAIFFGGSIESTREVYLDLGRRLKREATAAAVVHAFDDALAETKAIGASHRPLRYVEVNHAGITAGSETRVGQVFRLVGLVPSLEGGTGSAGCANSNCYLDLEALVAHPPEVFVDAASSWRYQSVTSLGRQHPVLTELLARTPVIHVDGRIAGCGAYLGWQLFPALAKEVQALARRLEMKP